jgi:hypothetical protein
MLDAEHNLIADVDAERFPKRSWDQHAPTVVNSHAGFAIP